MKLEIYESKPAEKEEPTRLALQQRGNNIVVMAVDKGGYRERQGDLIYFGNDGTILLAHSVNDTLGFQLGVGDSILLKD